MLYQAELDVDGPSLATNSFKLKRDLGQTGDIFARPPIETSRWDMLKPQRKVEVFIASAYGRIDAIEKLCFFCGGFHSVETLLLVCTPIL